MSLSIGLQDDGAINDSANLCSLAADLEATQRNLEMQRTAVLQVASERDTAQVHTERFCFISPV